MSETLRGAEADSVRVNLTDICTISNGTTAGVINFAYVIGAVSTLSNLSSLGSVMPRFYTMSQLYRQFRINRLVVKFVPNQPFTSGGSVGMGVDTSAVAGFPGGFGQIVHHNPSFLCDVKSAAQLTYIPSKKDPRYTLLASGTTEDELSYGQVQLYSSNTLPAGAPVGLLWFELDVTLIGPT